MHPSKNRIGILISGGGTTLKNLIDRRADDELQAEIACVISSSADAKGINFAEQAGVPRRIIAWQSHRDPVQFSNKIFQVLDEFDVDWVACGGFLRRLIVPEGYTNRVVNIHPSLIPAFCGKGYYGLKVHQAVIDYGCKVSGCTVHFVDNEFDHGPIIAQRSVPVYPNDTAEILAHRIFEIECLLYPAILNQLIKGQVHVSGRRVEIKE